MILLAVCSFSCSELASTQLPDACVQFERPEPVTVAADDLACGAFASPCLGLDRLPRPAFSRFLLGREPECDPV